MSPTSVKLLQYVAARDLADAKLEYHAFCGRFWQSTPLKLVIPRELSNRHAASGKKQFMYINAEERFL
jgi:hypothetical protein